MEIEKTRLKEYLLLIKSMAFLAGKIQKDIIWELMLVKNISNLDKYMNKKQSSLHPLCVPPHPSFLPYELKSFNCRR